MTAADRWETVKEQFGVALQRSESEAVGGSQPVLWRVIDADGHLSLAADEAAGIATLAFEARRSRAGQLHH